MVKLYSKFPDVQVLTTKGPIDFYKDIFGKGKWLFLFAHPADFTPVCTTEFVAFSQKYEEFKKLGVELVGLSVDSIYSHIQWLMDIEQRYGVKVPFPVIADPDKKLARMLDALDEASGQTIRIVVLASPDGIIRFVAQYPMEFGRNIDELLRITKAAIVNYKAKVVLPANWQPGQDVIVPPPAIFDEAEMRIKLPNAKAWYLLFKKYEELPPDQKV
ncbi:MULTISPECIES: peroxiredoxin [Sulfurisphaera]|uniref:Peroxiredoxin 1 n=3 Tax=Sulfurisphaera TaxID=69655 RepID=TDXH1_SULTO|nr:MULTISPECIES: peroxiredoxin [Sulfurisphaera]Q974S8.1 RecName: Full=Peroxiredoxin 1; AltName: Full=Thioredoxin-dependent peroxiredoxin 1 [Sulfurisphaera tokodaii str. 7]MBB5252825.1 peroxiredoxin (alkyl hydroperoxide reductase subunit C) [Sulfurisphaera ohwakuensis]QGR16238.1 peroxiredoxin [Sulfurisphaera ohwakuensis]BAK54339.1 peroxiredoxin [Sulfurisphaera tokodaii str. 7]HII74718.1 peroxiredoxin [Sulfurisphaera tokodaii]